VSYGEVNLKPGMTSLEGEYENPDEIKPVSGMKRQQQAFMNPLMLANSQQ
jgi:hypothetical protein